MDSRLKSTAISSFVPGCQSTFEGTGDSSLGPVIFAVEVTDDGEPGNLDTFSIQVTGAVTYAASGLLAAYASRRRFQGPAR